MSNVFQPAAVASFNLPEAELRLLIVEDSESDVELIELALKQAGLRFTYDTAETTAECELLLQTCLYDAVLSDYRLPGFTAYETLKLLQQSDQTIPLILVTGTLGEEAAVDCIKAGMTDYVLKDRLFRLPMVLARSLRELELQRQQQQAIAHIQQQGKREAILNRIVQAMRGTLVLDDVLQTTADLVHDVLQVSRSLIFLADPNQVMRIQFTSDQTRDGETLKGEECFIYTHLRTKLQQGQQVKLNFAEEAPPPQFQAVAEQFQIQTMLVTPLIYQQDYLGGICLQQCDRSRYWTEDEQVLMRAIADQCAIAIHQAQLFDQVQRQAQHEQLLNQIARALNSSLDPEHILQEIVRLTGECFEVDRVVMFAVEDGVIQVLKEWYVEKQLLSRIGQKTTLENWSDLVNSVEELAQIPVLHIPDFQSLPHPPERLKFLQELQLKSVLSASISVKEQFFGGLALCTTTAYRTFTEAEIHLLQQISDQAAIALYNAQSYELLEKLVQKRTKELEREKQLSEAANRSKSEFLAHMSHELRTPLTGILGFSSLLLKQVFGSLNSKQEQYVEGIASCGRHLLDLINDLLDLSKIEAGKEELSLEQVDIAEVCEACIAMIRQVASDRGLQLNLKMEPEITTCWADMRRVRQILCNLLSNAVKFTEVGSVSLNVSQCETIVEFAVIDTGIGIAEADQPKLFQSFQQLDGGLDRRYEGTGLGLVLAKKLAQLHGGDITVTSAVGKGSCFTLRLPVHGPQEPDH